MGEPSYKGGEKVSVTGVIRSAWNRLASALIRIRHGENGATAVEYGIMVALIAAVIVAVVLVLGQEINDAFQTVVDKIKN